MIGLIKSIISGWYSGKGFKAVRNRRHDDGVRYLELALKYSESDTNPVIYDTLAFSYYNVGNLNETQIYAEKSIQEYLETARSDPKIQEKKY